MASTAVPSRLIRNADRTRLASAPRPGHEEATIPRPDRSHGTRVIDILAPLGLLLMVAFVLTARRQNAAKRRVFEEYAEREVPSSRLPPWADDARTMW